MTAFVLPGTGLPALSDREFGQFQRLVHRESGIWLADGKRALLVGRLARRLRALGLASFGDYFAAAHADPAEQTRLLDAITTNETSFFREPKQITCLADTLCPAWERDAAAGRRTRRLRIWSAACSSGEEPYTLAMVLHDRLSPQGWAIDIVATDLSTRMLAKAEAGTYPVAAMESIDAGYRRRYWTKGGEAGELHATPGLRAMIRFSRANLHAPAWPVHGRFDAIFCRNVLIYFDQPSRHAVLRRLLGMIQPGGYLFLGHAESLSGLEGRTGWVMPAVYRVGDAKESA